MDNVLYDFAVVISMNLFLNKLTDDSHDTVMTVSPNLKQFLSSSVQAFSKSTAVYMI